MLFGLDVGEIGVMGLISDFDLFLLFFEIFDKLFKDDDFSGGDLCESCCFGVDVEEGCFFGFDIDLVGVGGCIFMIGINEGDFILLVLFEVYVKNVLGLWLFFVF